MIRFLQKRLIWTWVTIFGCMIIALPAVLVATASHSHGAVGARNGNTELSSPRLGTGLRPGTQFTPVTDSTLTIPEPVKGSDGRIHLAYELLLTKARALP